MAVDIPQTSVISRNRIAVFVKDDITASAICTGLEGISQTVDVRRGDIYTAVRLLVADTELHSVVADISDIDKPLVALEDLARVCPADVTVTLIGDRTDLTFYRAVMDLGVMEYLPKPLTRDAVQNLLRPKLAGDAPQPDRGGHIVAICVRCKAGLELPPLRLTLPLQLAETTKAKVALLDLHLQGGGETAVMLGLQPGPGLRIALEDPMRADTLFLERAAIPVNERVRLIAADEALDAEATYHWKLACVMCWDCCCDNASISS